MMATPLPGIGGTGYGNQYRSTRGQTGWTTVLRGPTGAQASINETGGFTADHDYSAFKVPQLGNVGLYGGSLDTGNPANSHYTLYPDGAIRLTGEGTIPTATDEDGYPNGFLDETAGRTRWMANGATHVIIETCTCFSGDDVAQQLLPEAPPTGTGAVYDRTPAGLKLISLLPGEVTPTVRSTFEGASRDGSVVMFKSGGTLYARVDNAFTVVVAAGDPVPAGLSHDGEEAFYALDGDLYRFDVASEQATQITSAGDARFVNVAPDGSHVYFLSRSQLDGGKGVAGALNLYVWDGATTTFIATADPGDIERTPFVSSGGQGLTAWAGASFAGSGAAAKNREVRANTSRTTPDGTVFAFESKARLTAYDNGGHYEVYRYETDAGEIACISCSPLLDSSESNASLTEIKNDFVGLSAEIPNLSPDGDAVFFQADDPLVGRDGNGTTDVYRWKASQGVALISTGRSSRPSLIRGIDSSGDNVFFSTGERLVPDGQEAGVPGVYVARVGGGFPASPEAPAPCAGDACQGQPSPPRGDTVPGSGSGSSPGNVDQGQRSSIGGLGGLSPSARVILAKGGRVRLRVRVSRAGTVRLVGTARVDKRKRRVVSASVRARKAGIVSVPFGLSRGALAHLRSSRSLKVALTVRFNDARPKAISLVIKSGGSKKGGRS
jgi:hypothetical protein